MNNSCYIYSPDGFDIDVLWNTKCLYERVGFSVFSGANPFPCNVLVILRGKPSELSAIHFPASDEIHLFDYAGQDTAAFANQLLDRQVLCISASEAAYARCNVTHGQVLIAGPYVDIERWVCKRPIRRNGKCCHIGNYKSQSAGDVYLEQMSRFVREQDVGVWGAGWETQLPSHRYYGHAYVHDVADIYSKFRFALGIMHPFQRDVTYSSRFWFGPLNGCTILSEPGSFVGLVPGVVQTDFSSADIFRHMAGETDPSAIMEASRCYWNAANDRLADALASRPRVIPVRVGWRSKLKARLRAISYWHGKEFSRRYFSGRH